MWKNGKNPKIEVFEERNWKERGWILLIFNK